MGLHEDSGYTIHHNDAKAILLATLGVLSKVAEVINELESGNTYGFFIGSCKLHFFHNLTVRKMPSVYDFNDDDDEENDSFRESIDILRIRPGRARVSFDSRCPVCGDRARTPEMVSHAIDDEGKICSYDNPGARWMEWHECPCCGEWFSLLNGN